MVLRLVPIRVRVVLAVAVPTLALLLFISIEVQGRARVEAAAYDELARTDVVEAVAASQSVNVLPEVAIVRQRIELAGLSRDQPSLGTVNSLWQLVLTRYREADAALSVVADRPDALSAQERATYRRQRAAMEALVDTIEEGGELTAELIDEAIESRREADIVMANVATASRSDAWIAYIGAVNASRTANAQYAYLLPTLIGLDVAEPTQLAELQGARLNATEKTALGLQPDLRLEVAEILESKAYDRWVEAESAGLRIAAGLEEPWSVPATAGLTLDALRLDTEITALGAESVERVRAELTATADDAATSRRRLLWFGAALVATSSVLTVWILRSIVGPLRDMTTRLAALARGEPDGLERDRGCDELSEMAHTIDQVADGLAHLGRQVEAIATGELDDLSLRAAAPGPVGAYVQRRVDELRKASSELRTDAVIDELTGVLNRRGLLESVAPPPRSHDRTVLFVDLDRFKRINDRFGHRHGDAVLRTVGARLAEITRAQDLVARLGGDEFVMVVDAVDQPVIDSLMARIDQAVTAPIEVNQQAHTIGCSIGYAPLGNDEDFAVALELADHAMLATKLKRRPAPPARPLDDQSVSSSGR